MRKIIFVYIIIVLPLLMSFLISYSDGDYPTRLKGRVKRCIEFGYDISDTTVISPKPYLYIKNIFEYNKKGQLIKIKTYNLDDNERFYLYEKIVISYDKSGKEIKTLMDFGDGNKQLYLLEYKNPDVIEQKVYENEDYLSKYSPPYTSLITIDSTDSITQIIEIKKDIGEKTIRIFDKMGTLINSQIINRDIPEKKEKFFYKYDKDGNAIEYWKIEEEKNKLINTFKYPKFDKNGNWLVQNTYDIKNRLIFISNRKINYF